VQLRSNATRLFIADDDSAIVELLTTRLGAAGYETRHAANGWRALEGIQAMSPDAVLLDINIPGMDGFAVLRALRQARHLASIPVLMLTARGAREDVAQAISLGAKDYMTKPFNNQELLVRVGRLTRRRSVRGQAGCDAPTSADDDALLI
jgi:two-component system OmpR family response regulator